MSSTASVLNSLSNLNRRCAFSILRSQLTLIIVTFLHREISDSLDFRLLRVGKMDIQQDEPSATNIRHMPSLIAVRDALVQVFLVEGQISWIVSEVILQEALRGVSLPER
jgi:hypothetical protein